MTWLPAVVTVAPVAEPISLAEAKAFLRVDGTNEDVTVAALISAARSHVEAQTGTALMAQTITASCGFWADLEAFPVAPLQTVSGITYTDGTGSIQTLATSVYQVVNPGLRPIIRLKYGQFWPGANTGQFWNGIPFQPDLITVTAVVGYATVPEAVIHAMKLLISQWFDSRTNFVDSRMTEVPNAVPALLANHRRYF